MSKPVFNDLFKFKGRRNRKSHNLYMLAYIVGSPIILFILVTIFPSIGNIGNGLLLIIVIPLAVSFFAIVSQRLRDTNHSGWWAILYFVPIVGFILFIYLVFKRGTLGDNQFDYDPLGLIG